MMNKKKGYKIAPKFNAITKKGKVQIDKAMEQTKKLKKMK